MCCAAVNLLLASPSPPDHVRAFGLQLLASCLNDGGDSGNGNILTLAQAISLINICSSSIIQDLPSAANVQTSKCSMSSFAPYPYPLVLPLPQQPLPPLHVAAAAGLQICCFLLIYSSLHA
jgi:hypothetical protein